MNNFLLNKISINFHIIVLKLHNSFIVFYWMWHVINSLYCTSMCLIKYNRLLSMSQSRLFRQRPNTMYKTRYVCMVYYFFPFYSFFSFILFFMFFNSLAFSWFSSFGRRTIVLINSAKWTKPRRKKMSWLTFLSSLRVEKKKSGHYFLFFFFANTVEFMTSEQAHSQYWWGISLVIHSWAPRRRQKTTVFFLLWLTYCI